MRRRLPHDRPMTSAPLAGSGHCRDHPSCGYSPSRKKGRGPHHRLALGQAQSPADPRHRRGNRIRLQFRAVWVGENQVQVGAVARAELPAELILAQSVRFEDPGRSRRQCDVARLSVFVVL